MSRIWNEASLRAKVSVATFLAILTSLCVAMTVWNPSVSESTAYGEDYISLYLRDNPGIPPVLPVRLPEDVRFLGYDTTRVERGRVVLRSAQFAGRPYSAHPVQTVCIEWAQQKSECASMIGQREAVTRNLENIRVTVVTGSSSEASAEVTDFWRNALLTTDLDDVRWLQR